MIHQSKISILLITFIRKKNIRKLIEKIDRNIKGNIYIYSNYSNLKNKKAKITKIRTLVKKIKTTNKKIYNFSKVNREVNDSIPHAISWFFSNEKQGIILEDDCIPSDQFFTFCKGNIRKLYTKNFMLISGNRYSPANNNYNKIFYSYFFHGWGWATTKKNWKLFINYYREKKNINKVNIIFPKFNKNTTKLYWQNIFNIIMKIRLLSWDYMFQKFIFEKKKYSIIPNKNLVKNNGIDKLAQNTFKKNTLNSLEKNFKLKMISLSEEIVYDKKNDLWEEKFLYGSIKSLIFNYVKKFFL